MTKFSTSLFFLVLSAGVAHADMQMSFKWGNLALCTSGNPNRVSSPEFILKGVPAGTTKIIFKMKDLDVPGYNHGGGTVKVKMGASGTIGSGAFKYKSPCPPNGSHTYQWTATAKAGSKTVATASARRRYPE
ncbi:MAG: YbhB/YbcL family Raf kinase inhibitor-like protein [Pseudomonadota bacterium]